MAIFFIIPCGKYAYAHFVISEIGFVLHKRVCWKYVIIERVPKVPKVS